MLFKNKLVCVWVCARGCVCGCVCVGDGCVCGGVGRNKRTHRDEKPVHGKEVYVAPLVATKTQHRQKYISKLIN